MSGRNFGYLNGAVNLGMLGITWNGRDSDPGDGDHMMDVVPCQCEGASTLAWLSHDWHLDIRLLGEHHVGRVGQNRQLGHEERRPRLDQEAQDADAPRVLLLLTR